MDNFKEKAVSATIWSSIHRFGTLTISFISSVILSRIITPTEYGCIGLLVIFIELSNTLINGGFGNALIQKKNTNEQDYSTVFHWNFLFSIILYAILFFSSGSIASFFKTDILEDILKIEGLVIILNALGLVYDVRLRKFIKFSRLAIVDIFSTIISVGLCMYMAYSGYGVWSLVAQYLSFSFSRLVLLFLFDRWLPKLCFSKKSFLSLFYFGGFMLLTTILNTISRNFQGLIIGRKFLPSDMGFFTKARTLEEIPSLSVASIISQITLPLFSEIQDDMDKMKKLIISLNISIAFFIFPLMILLMLTARPLIIILFSDIWLESIPYFQILCLAGIFVCLQDVNYFAVASIGKSRVLFRWTIVKQIFNISILLLGVYLGGIKGMLYCMVITAFLIFIINISLSKIYIGFKLKNVIKTLMILLALSISSSFLPIIFGIKFDYINIYLLVIIQSLLFIFSYLILFIIVKFYGKDDIISITKLFTQKIINKCKH